MGVGAVEGDEDVVDEVLIVDEDVAACGSEGTQTLI